MAAKNARRSNSPERSADIDGAASDDAIRALIDGPDSGDGTGQGNRDGRDVGDEIDGGRSDGGGGGEGGEGGVRTPADNHRARARTGAGKRSGARSRSARTGDGNATAREESEHLREDISRPVKPNKVKGVIEEEKFDFSASSAELIGDIYSVMFWMIGQATDVPEWKLGETKEGIDEAEFLGERTEKFIKSLGKRRATNLMKSLGKIGPALGFVGAIAMVTSPRVKLTIHRAKHGTESLPTTRREEPEAPAAAAAEPAPASDLPVNEGSGGDVTALRERSFSASDFGEVTQGHALES